MKCFITKQSCTLPIYSFSSENDIRTIKWITHFMPIIMVGPGIWHQNRVWYGEYHNQSHILHLWFDNCCTRYPKATNKAQFLVDCFSSIPIPVQISWVSPTCSGFGCYLAARTTQTRNSEQLSRKEMASVTRKPCIAPLRHISDCFQSSLGRISWTLTK